MVQNLWWARNSFVFKNEFIPPEVTANLIGKLAKEYMVETKNKNPRLLSMPALDFQMSWEFFNEASQGHPPLCRVGVILHVSHNHYIHIQYAPGRGSNNRAEFITLWNLLEAVTKKGLTKLQVLRDSKLIIDWANGKVSVSDVRLSSLLKELRQSIQSFKWLSFCRIFRELNIKADALSKEALPLLTGTLGFYKFVDHEEMESLEFRL